LAEEGSLADLMQRGGIYRAMYERQKLEEKLV
jgi:hypothetical protein